MRKLFAVAAAMVCMFGTTPAFAGVEDHEGLRIGGLAGVLGNDSPFDDAEISFGGVIGYDFAVGSDLLLGIEADITSTNASPDILGVFGPRIDANVRQISVAARGTYPISANAALFASAGYSNVRLSGNLLEGSNFDGFRIGAGSEYKIINNIYSSLEYRFNEYEGNLGAHQILIGAGVRF